MKIRQYMNTLTLKIEGATAWWWWWLLLWWWRRWWWWWWQSWFYIMMILYIMTIRKRIDDTTMGFSKTDSFQNDLNSCDLYVSMHRCTKISWSTLLTDGWVGILCLLWQRNISSNTTCNWDSWGTGFFFIYSIIIYNLIYNRIIYNNICTLCVWKTFRSQKGSLKACDHHFPPLKFMRESTTVQVEPQQTASLSQKTTASYEKVGW